MKFRSLLSAGLMLSCCSFAQQTLPLQVQELQQQFSGKKSNGLHNPQAKTTATASRIKSYVTASHDGASFVPADSLLILSYTGENGGGLTDGFLYGGQEIIKYDSYIVLHYDAGTLTWTNSQKSTNSFDPNNNISGTVYQTWDPVGSVWENDYRDSYTYDGSGNMLTDIYQNWNTVSTSWDNDDKNIYTYDAANNMLTNVFQDWNSGTNSWDNYQKHINTYDPNNNPTQEVVQQWVGGAWENYYKVTRTFNGTNQMTQYVIQNWDTGTNTWENNNKFIYTYNGSGDNVEEVEQFWLSGPATWRNQTKNTRTFDANHNVNIDIEQTWDNVGTVWVNDTRTTIQHNSYNQITDLLTESWNIGGFWENVPGNATYKIRYEEYTVTGIADINKGGNSNIYPSPAKDQITIDLNWDVQQSFSITIYDLQGREMLQWNAAPAKEYRKSVNVSALPSGNYIISITGEKGKMVQQVSVIH